MRRSRPFTGLALAASLAIPLGASDSWAAAPHSASLPAVQPLKAKKDDKPKPREPGSEPGEPNEAVRRILTGEYPHHSTTPPSESEELKALREVDRALFPPQPAPAGAPWDTTLILPAPGPKADLSGLPESAKSSKDAKEGEAEGGDLSWLADLKKPDFPVRFEPSVVRYLEYYRDSARGQRLIKAWIKKSGRYRDAIAKQLRAHEMPEDLVWLAMAESAFDSTIHSHAGAAGLWQFMPATGRIYGLTVSRSVDERLDPERATLAALRHLKDLHKRFGTWELAMGAYNMGYGGMLASVRRYNTNDYWELRRLEAGLPYETALYVPKIMALAIVAKNCDKFDCDNVQLDAPLPFGDEGVDKVAAAPGVTLEDVAKATSVGEKEIAALNPHFTGSRLPPIENATKPRTSWTLYVPKGKGESAAAEIPKQARRRKLGTHKVRWGETLASAAASFETSTGYLESLNDLYAHESPRPGTVIFVPHGRTPKSTGELAKALELVAAVPQQKFHYDDRRRVFYEPVFGDTVEEVAAVVGVTPAEIRLWNRLDERASLQERMRLQLYIEKDAHPSDVVLFEDGDLGVVEVGTDAFYANHLDARGRQRIVVTVKEGESWKTLSDRYDISRGELERINHKSRRSKLNAGDEVVVYAKKSAIPKTED